MNVRKGLDLCFSIVIAGNLCGCSHWTERLQVPRSVAQEYAALAPLPVGAADECWSPRGPQLFGTRVRAIALCRGRDSLIRIPRAMRIGGVSNRPFVIWFQRDDGTRFRAFTAAQVGHALAPIDSPGLALTLLALLGEGWDLPRLWDPWDEDLEHTSESFGWAPSSPLVQPDVIADGEGWRVRWPVYSRFGCGHDLRLPIFHVSEQGEVERERGPVETLAIATAQVCAD